MTSLRDFDYEDIKVIGRGQYGKAHLVKSNKDQLHYIAKTIELTCLSSKERETALQEVALLRRLDHPNIVEYKDNFFMSDTLVIVMQYCESGDLANYIKDMVKKKTRIRETQVMNYFVQILQALQYIHDERILHRDLKTSNLFLMQSKSVVKLGDFGISRVLEGSMAAAVTVVGTPYYMSPEVCENKPYTFKSDVWSLGCVLYELCMLKHAFSADNLLGLVYKIVSDKYEPIPKMYSQPLNLLIQAMLDKKAESRPSVRDLFAHDFVQTFMKDYIRTRGMCTSGAPRTADSSVATLRSGPAGGSGTAARGSGTRSPDSQGAPHPAAPSAEQRAPRTRPVRTAGGGTRGPRVDAGAAGTKNETPKEAAMRRKREAADKQGAELKVAAKQSAQNKTVARKMKEAEFQTTRLGTGMGAATTQYPVSPGGTTMGSAAPTVADEDDNDSFTEDELSEEIDEDSEEYEDDFEDELCSEEEIEDEIGADVQYVPDGGGGNGFGVLSTVREEADISRVMNNYEQDLARAHVGASPPPRRPSTEQRNAQVPPPVQLGGAPMDIRSRANRLKDELVCKLGPETFQRAFDLIYDARSRNVALNRKELEALVGRENYKSVCFEIDQLVFQQQMLPSS